MTGKAPYKFESGFLRRGSTANLTTDDVTGLHSSRQRLGTCSLQPENRTRFSARAPRCSPAGTDLGARGGEIPLRDRHVVTDTSGLLVGIAVHSANIRDRDGAGLVIEAIHDLFPWLRHLFADSVYNGPNLHERLVKFGDWTIEIVKRATEAKGFHLLPRRWVVERTWHGSIETAA